MLVDQFRVDSPHVKYEEDAITSEYQYQSSELERAGGSWVVKPTSTSYQFKTSTAVPKLGCVSVGGMPDACEHMGQGIGLPQDTAARVWEAEARGASQAQTVRRAAPHWFPRA